MSIDLEGKTVRIIKDKGTDDGYPVGSLAAVVSIDHDGTVWGEFTQGTAGVDTTKNPWPIGDADELGLTFEVISE
jgi:hypothetical protein